MGATQASTATLGTEQARLVAVDVFDTDPSTVVRVLANHGEALRSLVQDHSPRRLDSIAEEIRSDGRYAYVKPVLVTYFDAKGQTSYITIDIVDDRDARWRMPFAPAPSGTYRDPEGLIAAWEAYDDKVSDLRDRGEQLAPPTDCPSFHCLGDPRHPALRSLANQMAAGVPGHVGEIATILRDDHVATNRAAAAYLLAYAPDGHVLVADLLPALHDPSALVRNNAMRVLAEIALNHPELDVPLDPIIEALAYPATSDRNKAAAILDRLLKRPGMARLHDRIIRKAGCTLLALLRLQQPNNHDFAYRILKTVSGQAFGERDIGAWQAWLSEAEAN